MFSDKYMPRLGPSTVSIKDVKNDKFDNIQWMQEQEAEKEDEDDEEEDEETDRQEIYNFSHVLRFGPELGTFGILLFFQ